MTASSSSHARGTLTDMVVRVLDRRVGALGGEAGRAVATTHAFLVFCVLLTLSYAAFYMTYDLIGLAPLIVLHIFWVAAYVGGILLARLGRQLSASLVAFTVATVQMVTATAFLGWEAGTHLFLLGGGQLVYIMLTERQRLWRWAWVVIALAAFLVCQFTMPPESALYVMPTVLLHALFSVNAVVTAFTLFMGAALAHYRVEQARSLAADAAQRAEYLANTDVLTGLSTRRPVLERLATLARVDGEDYCLAIADLDRFKALNDEHGHGCGDQVLEEVGARLRAALRLTDSVGRWGGEEFIMVLPGATLAAASVTMERIRDAVGSDAVPCHGHEHRVTISIGLTIGDHTGLGQPTITRADDALYEAKRKGRDQVVVTTPHEESPTVPPAYRGRDQA